MGNALKKRQKKLARRRAVFATMKNTARSKRGNLAYKEPGSMNLRKQV